MRFPEYADGRLKIGEISGISVELHYSWFALFGIVTLSVATYLTSILHVSRATVWGAVAILLVGALGAGLVFTSIVLHEFAHALTARRFGIETISVTLFVFGGRARLEREPDSPKAEFWIAVAGPLSSLAFALFLFVLVSIDFYTLHIATLDTVLWYVIIVNVVVAIFNSIPALPMDGGQALRALIWWVTKRPAASRALVSLYGMGFGTIFGFVGIVMFLQTHLPNFAWYVAVSVFIIRMTWLSFRNANAAAELESADLRARREAKMLLLGNQK